MMGEMGTAITAEVERPALDMAEATVAATPETLLDARRSLLRLACFCAVTALVAWALSAAISVGLRNVKTSAFGAWNAVMQGRVNAAIVISGSSRAAYHYDPRVIETATGLSAFNIGRTGTQTDVQLAVLRAYLEHNRKPDLIVHNLDAFSFVTSREIFDPALYIPYLSDRELYQPLLAINPELYKSRYVPLYGYVVDDMNLTWVTGLKALFGYNPKQDYILGFSPRDKTWTDDFDKYKESHPQGVSFAIEPRGVRELKELAATCRDNNIRLVFVYSPEYSEMQALTTDRQKIFGQFRQIAAEYAVPLWDYSNWKYSDDRDLFYNSQHLNARGAALFSQDFSRRLEAYVVHEGIGRAKTRPSGEALDVNRGAQ